MDKSIKISVKDLEIGKLATLRNLLSGSSYYRQRLLAFGLIPGVKFRILQVAPLGCPIEIALENGTRVSLRKKEGEILVVEPEE